MKYAEDDVCIERSASRDEPARDGDPAEVVGGGIGGWVEVTEEKGDPCAAERDAVG